MTDTDAAFRALAAHLRAERARADLTQPELSRLAGVHVVTISNIERDYANMSLDKLLKIAPALGVTPGQFLNAALAHTTPIAEGPTPCPCSPSKPAPPPPIRFR